MCCTVPEEYVHRKSVIQPFWTRSGKIIFYGFVPDTHAPGGGIPYDNDSVQDLDGLEVALFFFFMRRTKSGNLWRYKDEERLFFPPGFFFFGVYPEIVTLDGRNRGFELQT